MGYLEMANNASKKQETQKSVFTRQVAAREGVTLIQMDRFQVIDATGAITQFNLNDIQHAMAFGFIIKIHSTKLNAPIYLVEDLFLKQRIQVLVGEIAVFTLNETKMISKTKLSKADLQSIYTINAILGCTLVEFNLTPDEINE
jgi:hypothetical protein